MLIIHDIVAHVRQCCDVCIGPVIATAAEVRHLLENDNGVVDVTQQETRLLASEKRWRQPLPAVSSDALRVLKLLTQQTVRAVTRDQIKDLLDMGSDTASRVMNELLDAIPQLVERPRRGGIRLTSLGREWYPKGYFDAEDE